MQVCISLQTDNHASTPPLKFFYRPDALPAAQPTASKHWRQVSHHYSAINSSFVRHHKMITLYYWQSPLQLSVMCNCIKSSISIRAVFLMKVSWVLVIYFYTDFRCLLHQQQSVLQVMIIANNVRTWSDHVFWLRIFVCNRSDNWRLMINLLFIKLENVHY